MCDLADYLEQRGFEATRQNVVSSMGKILGDAQLSETQRLTLLTTLHGLYKDSIGAEEGTMALLGQVIHDLRSPLVVIRGYLELLDLGRLGALTDTQRSSVQIVLRNSLILEDRLDTLLEFARHEQGRLTLARERVSIATIVAKATVAMPAIAERAGITFSAPIVPVEDDCAILADRGRLIRVLRNLLDNAIQAASEGSVELRATQDAGEVTFTVTDTGPGIPPEHIDRVVTPFHKVPDADGRTCSKGTGLGLTVAHHLVAAHGAVLHLDSNPGKGTRVWFTLPVLDR